MNVRRENLFLCGWQPWTPTAPAWETRSYEGVVEPAEPGEVTWSSWPTHESEAEPQGSRMFLLERYQEVVDERDGMAREIMGLNAAETAHA